MSEGMTIKIGFTIVGSLVFGSIVAFRSRREEGKDDYGYRPRYLGYVSGAILPAAVLSWAILFFLCYGGRAAAQALLSACFGIFLHIGVYYIVLLLLLPFFRERISARACAMLWMIPNYLYLTEMGGMELPGPAFVLQAPERLVWGLFTVWLLGFAGVLAWSILSHLRFRRQILSTAREVTDPAVLDVWEEELKNANFIEPWFRLVTSPAVSSPLSIGLFRHATRVVLPERQYSAGDLHLIFRHELVHIGREDSWSKFFLVFCTAMCWFNPFMWKAMQKSADDLELSCDETVLVNAGADTRKQYAGLILETAGDGRGFTTCLSAAASSLRYRLQNIIRPPRKHSGALTAGLMFFLLCMSCGYVALAYGGGRGADLFFGEGGPSEYTLAYVNEVDGSSYLPLACTDETALHDYLASVELRELTGNYDFREEERKIMVLYDTSDGFISVILSDGMAKVARFGDRMESEFYYLPDKTNWEYLDTILEPAAQVLSAETETGPVPERQKR